MTISVIARSGRPGHHVALADWPGVVCVVHEIHIRQWFRCSPETVFALFHHHDRLSEVYPGRFRRVRLAPGLDPDGAGSEREVRLPGLRVREKVTRCDVPSLIEYRIVAGMPLVARHRGIMRFQPEASGTLLDFRIEIAFRLPAGRLLASAMEQVVRTRLAALAGRLTAEEPT